VFFVSSGFFNDRKIMTVQTRECILGECHKSETAMLHFFIFHARIYAYVMLEDIVKKP
jgi:hypothetical protein